MGIKGLMSVCLERQDECTVNFDLVEEARRNQGLELLVDFYSFEHHILNKLWTSLALLRQNKYIRILGGEYASLDAYLAKLVEDLQSLDIKLVFFVDGGKGSSTEALRQKLDTWIMRHEQDIEKMQTILEVCRGRLEMEDLDADTKIRPVVLEDQVRAVLSRYDCEFHQSPAGEADLILARALRDRPKAFAILSGDTDFCVMKGCRFIPFSLFDVSNDLRLGELQEVPEKPLRLLVKVITPDRVAAMLQLKNHELLVELSIVAGNDFTGPYMWESLQQQLDVRGRRNISNFAGWIRHYKHIENNPVLSKEMHKNRGFREAVYHSRDFYNLQGQPDLPPRKGYFSQVIEEGIRSGQLPCSTMSMHNNFYWYRMLLEDNMYGQPAVECTLAPLRAFVYRIVLPRHENLVNEYGRTPYESLRKAGIMAAECDDLYPIHKIQSNRIFQNLRTFHVIMSHQERGNCTTNWFDRYGRKNGFILYLLRYFLHLCWGKNLHITENEYLALVAMVFCRAKETEFQTIVIRPTPRCVTIGNWFQDLYRHGYSMLGSILNLKHEFPVPHEIYSGSMWTAMYMVCKDDTFYQAARQVHVDVLYNVQTKMNAVIKEKRHILRHVVEGFFQFDDR